MNRPTYTCDLCGKPGWGHPAPRDGRPVHPKHNRPRPKVRPDPIIEEIRQEARERKRHGTE